MNLPSLKVYVPFALNHFNFLFLLAISCCHLNSITINIRLY